MKVPLRLLPLVVLLAVSGAGGTARAVAVSTGSEIRPLQFTTDGHVLGFTPREVVVATGTRALRIEFVGAPGVTPIAAGSFVPEGRTAPLTRVTYPGLWQGITLAYDAPSGLLRSTYTVDPGADPKQIRLRYSAPVTVEPAGELRIAFAAGAMHESAPLGWQDLDGRRVPVSVAFRKISDREVGFQFGSYDKARPLTIDPTLTWSTVLGGSGDDHSFGIALDADGNVYVAGYSDCSWGNPIHAFSGGRGLPNGFVAKLDANGVLLWNTFFGGTFGDYICGIALDAIGNIYVSGYSLGTWGNPIRVFGGGAMNAFVARLNADGALAWNTFLGGTIRDYGHSVAVDSIGNVYVTGTSEATWGNPLNAFAGGGEDAFVAKLDTNGGLLWSTFLGGTGKDRGVGIAVDANSNVCVTGGTKTTWGNPIGAYTGGTFVAKLDADGGLVWNTFLGGTFSDYGYAIAVDGIGDVYVTGISNTTSWGNPIRAFGGYVDAFVAKLNTNGALLWNTFLGGTLGDYGYGIAVDEQGSIFVTGRSEDTWGNPIHAFSLGAPNAFVARLSTNGALALNTFMRGPGDTMGDAIAVDAGGKVYITGFSTSNPLTFTGAAFVALISDTSTLTVASGNPASGVGVSVSPTDLNAAGDGITQFTRVYLNGTQVTLTAPAIADGDDFVSWAGCTSVNGRTCTVSLDVGTTVTANYTAPASWRSGETDVGGTWKWSDLGYYTFTFAPWVYHLQHGFLYPFDDGTGGVFFWDAGMSRFWWTRSGVYPWLYRFDDTPTWLWYQRDTANPRWFYNWGTSAWESVP